MNDLTDIREIKALLERHGFRFSKSMGQNFLVRPWVPEKVSESAGIDGQTGVLEIGPGIGCLTKKLSDKAGKVVAIELDRSLAPVLEETLESCSNVEIIYADVLKQDLRGIVTDRFDGLRPVVCANLPYNITSPVISAMLKADCFDTMTLMVQKEVAKRICAMAGEADYSAFSIFVRWYTEPSMLFDVPPDCFLPQPKVTSSVIRLDSLKEPICRVTDENLMFMLVRAAFGQRRKTLVNALSPAVRDLSRQELADSIAASGLDINVRGETLSIEDYCLLSDEISRRIRLFKQ